MTRIGKEKKCDTLAILQKKLDCQEVEFRFCQRGQQDLLIYSDRDGRLDYWPAGFFDQLDLELLGTLLKG